MARKNNKNFLDHQKTERWEIEILCEETKRNLGFSWVKNQHEFKIHSWGLHVYPDYSIEDNILFNLSRVKQLVMVDNPLKEECSKIEVKVTIKLQNYTAILFDIKKIPESNFTIVYKNILNSILEQLEKKNNFFQVHQNISKHFGIKSSSIDRRNDC